MNINIVYVAVSQGPICADYCSRFVGSFLENPPGVDCTVTVACNGGPLPIETALMFDPIKARFFPRENDSGHDMSAYQHAAQKLPCDCQINFGESVHFWKPGWLVPIVEAWRKYGPGFYGFFSSFLVRPHLNTTAFACDPKLLNGYPRILDHRSRYEAEHGVNSIWSRFVRFGRPVKLVTWDGAYSPQQWRSAPNIMWRGDQSNCLVWANHTDRWFAADTVTRANWSAGADRLPR